MNSISTTAEVNKHEKIFIGVAWPYANGSQHLGHLAGCYLPADVFARFSRMTNKDVLMVSGSDTHGTPVTITAKNEGLKPIDIVNKYHKEFIESYKKIGLTFDLFTSTHTQNHTKVVHEMFLQILEAGYIYKDSSKQLFDLDANCFLPDRYVEGDCPNCGASGARGDQCDKCGKTYDSIDLINPVSKISNSKAIEIRETDHFYLDLSKLNEELITYLNTDKSHWRKHVLNFSKNEVEKRELRGRAISRDMQWGVSIPLAGLDEKVLYVWFEAVIGYLSASVEYSKLKGDENLWKKWLDKDSDSKSYYFIGKDNTVFHTIIWPAIILASKSLSLPYDVPANEYLNNKGAKFSKSKGNGAFVEQMLKDYQSDVIRYVLISIAPETSDVEFSMEMFYERVNNELIANWGNLVNRILGFTFKKCDAKIPIPAEFIDIDQTLLDNVLNAAKEVKELYEKVRLKSALEKIRALSQSVNQYLNVTEPWSLIKKDAQRAHTVLYVTLQCIDWLNRMWAPIIPLSAQKVSNFLGYEDSLFGELSSKMVKDEFGEHEVLSYDNSSATLNWEFAKLKSGQEMTKPSALFKKLEDKDETEDGK